jgi:hypothetical protein
MKMHAVRENMFPEERRIEREDKAELVVATSNYWKAQN